MRIPVRARAALSVAVVSAGACALAPVGAATAASAKAGVETTTTVYDHDTATYPAGDPFCPFPVERTLDGVFHTRTTTYADGSVLVHEWVSDFSYQLVNPANGTTLYSHLGGTEDLTFAPDGTLLSDEIRGNDINFTVPGGGRLTGYVGHLRQVTLPDGSTTIDIQTHNMADSIFTEACRYLA
jgi:hypothetical protein